MEKDSGCDGSDGRKDKRVVRGGEKKTVWGGGGEGKGKRKKS